mgnify:FL=1
MDDYKKQFLDIVANSFLEEYDEQLNNLYNQQEAAKAEVGKPFPQEAEADSQSQRLAELDAA